MVLVLLGKIRCSEVETSKRLLPHVLPELGSARMRKAMFSADCLKSRDRDGGDKY